MALTKKDLQLLTKTIKTVVEEVVETKLEEKLEVKLEQKLEQKFNEKLKDFPTREEVRQIVHQEIKEALTEYADRDELDDKLAELRSDFYNKVDPFLTEIPESRAERDMYAEKVYDHEDRIGVLENWQQKQIKLAM